MKLTHGQTTAYDMVMLWINDKASPWCFKLAGFAGTGKTTLLQRIVNTLDETPLCCAPTGKAASVLEKKMDGSAIVTTVHKALYSPDSPSSELLDDLLIRLKKAPNDAAIKQEFDIEKERLSKQKLSFTSKVRPGEFSGKLYIVDEASMITRKMAQDFQCSGAKVLFVGDPGQLPPVGDQGWFGHDDADYMLTEVMRQALDNPIIRLSMDIRSQGLCDPNKYRGLNEVALVNKAELSTEHWVNADQVLTGSNYLRRRINRFLRKQLGYEGKLPMDGEKLICLKNDFDNHGFINGVPASCIQDAAIDESGELCASILFEDQAYSALALYEYPFNIHYDERAEEEPWVMRQGLAEFDWAYAITVHKSQGSEWNNIILADDGFWMNRPIDRKRWLYTAVTRAKEKLTWVVG